MKTSSRLKLLATAASVARATTRTGGPTFPERAQALPRLVRATLDGTYAGTSIGRLAALAGAVVYVVSPIDLLPEMLLPILGAADDAVVISWAMRTLVDETDSFLAWERGQGIRPQAGASSDEPLGVVANRMVGRRAGGLGPTAVGGAAAPGRSVARGGTRGGTREGRRDGVRDAAAAYVMESVRRRLEP